MPGGSSAQGKRSSPTTPAFMRCHEEGLNLPVRLGLREMRGRLRRSGPRGGPVCTPTTRFDLMSQDMTYGGSPSFQTPVRVSGVQCHPSQMVTAVPRSP